MNGIPGLQSNYPVIKTPNLKAIPAKGLNYPPGDSIQITRGLGGYTRRVRSRAPSGESKYPLGDSTRITRGLGGYTHRVCSRAPSGESKYPPGRFYPNHLGTQGLHPLGALAHTLWKVKSPLSDSIRITYELGGY